MFKDTKRALRRHQTACYVQKQVRYLDWSSYDKSFYSDMGRYKKKALFGCSNPRCRFCTNPRRLDGDITQAEKNNKLKEKEGFREYFDSILFDY